MTERNKELKNGFKLILTLIFVYVILFEFILPVNKYLPKPSILAESILHIITEYNLASSASVSFIVVSVALVIAYIAVLVRANFLIKIFTAYRESLNSLRIFRYVPVIILIVLFNLWFDDKLLWEFIAGILYALLLSFSKLQEKIKDVKSEYIVVGKNLGLSEIEINEKIHWKYLQPILIKYYEKMIIHLWGLILFFEYIGDTYGMGHAIHKALAYKDLNAIILFSIILYVLIWFTKFVIKLIRNKYYNWAG